jgi:hypothetical protein
VIAAERLSAFLEGGELTREERDKLITAYELLRTHASQLEHTLTVIDEALGWNTAPEPAVIVDPVIADEETEPE